MRELESWQRALKLEGSRLANRVDAVDRIAEDPASNVLEWILLVVAVACFAVLGWMTDLTYKASPPFPDRFVCAQGMLLMSATGIQAVDDSTVFWQWMRMPGNIVSALGAVLMAWDFVMTLRPPFPRFAARLTAGVPAASGAIGGAE